MAGIEPKSGKLYKFGHSLFGPKWTEKWVHLDHHVLKYFSMASEQTPRLSLSSARQSYSIVLAGYDIVLQDDKRITRKHAFHLLPKNKTSKAYVFACANEKELHEWQAAFQARSSTAGGEDTSPIIAERLRRASDAFTAGDISEYSLLQQQLDPNVDGKISRDQFLRVMKHYFTSRTRVGAPVEKKQYPENHDTETTPRSSFSDHPRPIKCSERSDPEAVSELEPSDEPLHPTNHSPGSVTGVNEVVSYELLTESICGELPARDWETEFLRFQAENNSDSDPVSCGLEMAAFIAAFQLAAETAVEELVHDIIVNDDERSVHSLSLDDDQFLATDYADANEPWRLSVTKFAVDGLLIYITHDETTHKVFGHHLRAARAVHDAIMETGACSLRVPLQCIVDYLGFRALVFARLPLLHETRIRSSRMLVSCDQNQQSIVLKQLEAVGKHLGIFVDNVGGLQGLGEATQDRLPQFVGASTGVFATVENGRFVVYLHNLVDMFPAKASPQELSLSPLRPELVSQLGDSLPLHPQWCGPCFSDEQRIIFEQAMMTAEEHLRWVVLPAFVDAVDNQSALVYDSFTLTEALHRDGIPARYLGLCYEAASSKHAKSLFLSEIIGRAAKNELRASLKCVFLDAADGAKRTVWDHPLDDACGESIESSWNSAAQAETEARGSHPASREIVEDTAMRVVHEFFNLVFERQASDANAFWQARILPRVQQQFVVSDPATWMELQGDKSVSNEVLQAVLYRTNVRTIDGGSNFLSNRPFPDAEAFSIGSPHSTPLCQTTHACKQRVSQANELVAAGDIETAVEYVRTQIAIEDTSFRGIASAALVSLLIWAAELSLVLVQLDESERLVSLALEASRPKSVAYAHGLLVKMRVQHAKSHPVNEIRLLFADAVQTLQDLFGGVVHPFLLDLHMAMIAISRDRGDLEGTFQLFHQVAALVRDAHGKRSVAYADLRRQEADALVESGRIDDAASVFDEAFSVYERLAQESEGDAVIIQEIWIQAASCLHRIALLQAGNTSGNGLEAAFSTAVRALSIRRENLPHNHADIMSSLLQLGEVCAALGDWYRVIEFYRPALVQLKAAATEESLSLLRKVSQALLNAHIQSLPAQKAAVVEKTKKRFANVVESLQAALIDASNISPSDGEQASATRDLELIRKVTQDLLEKDPVDLLDQLLEKVDEEWRSLRRERFKSGAARSESVAEDPTSPARVSLTPSTSASSRFVSFAVGQSHPQKSPLSTTTTSESLTLLTTPTGEFTYGGQLAVLLFLASLPDE